MRMNLVTGKMEEGEGDPALASHSERDAPSEAGSMKLILRTPELRRRAMEAIKALPLNEVWECDLKPWKSTRSLEANARYWVILTEISDQLRPDGNEYSPETWHRFFKAKFLGKDTVVIDGEVLLIERSTAKLKSRVFSDYTVQCEVYGVEHGVKFSDFRQGA